MPTTVKITPQEALQRTIEHREIFHDEMLHLMRQIMSGEMSPVMMAALLVGLRVKKETIGEITAAAEMVTLCAASGYAVHFFPTGQGNVIGNPILPVIKLCANPKTVRTMGEHVDVDVSGLLRKEMNPDQAGDALLECMFRTANGRLTAAEALGHREFVLTRLFESA